MHFVETSIIFTRKGGAEVALYVDPSGSSVLMQILAPAFVVVSVTSRALKEKLVRLARRLSTLITGGCVD